MTVSDFTQPRTREHTFDSTGRTVVLLESFPMQALVRNGTLSDDLIETFEAITSEDEADTVPPRKQLEVSDLIVRTMFVEPKIGDGEGCISLDLVADSEANETVIVALLGAQGAARFREESKRARAGAGSQDVAHEPVADGGPAAGDA